MTNYGLYGLDRVLYGYRGSTGYFLGGLGTGTVTAPQKGVPLGAQTVGAAQSATDPQKTIAIRTITASGRVIGKKIIGVSDLGEGSIVMQTINADFLADIRNTTLNTTNITSATQLPFNANNTVPPSMYLIYVSYFDDDNGNPQYETRVFYNVEVSDTGLQTTGGEGENVDPVNLTFVPKVSNRHLSGQLLSASGLTVANNTDTGISLIGTYPFYVCTFIGTGAVSNFTLPFLPLFNDEDGSTNNSITRDGLKTSLAIDTINTTTGVVTFTSAPADGVVYTFLYPTVFATA